MKIVNIECFSKFVQGWFIESYSYYFDDFCDCYILKFELSAKESKDFTINLILYSPNNIKLYHCEHEVQLGQLEILDYSEYGYDSSMKYRFHDIEEEQIDVFFEKYEISLE